MTRHKYSVAKCTCFGGTDQLTAIDCQLIQTVTRERKNCIT